MRTSTIDWNRGLTRASYDINDEPEMNAFHPPMGRRESLASGLHSDRFFNQRLELTLSEGAHWRHRRGALARLVRASHRGAPRRL
jgi:hypothetical protein